ncbi:MAG: hypothetical protein ACKOC6_08425 [bacterium]
MEERWTALQAKAAQLEQDHAALTTANTELTERQTSLGAQGERSEQERARLEQELALLTEMQESLTAKHSNSEQERLALLKRFEELQSKLQGQDAGSIVAELAALKKEQREWVAERRDVASRIEAITAKLDRLD